MQAESLERAKFAEFMSLAPAPLTSWAMGLGRKDQEDDNKTGLRRDTAPKYYEKQLVIKRGSRRQPLGFEMKMSVPETGGTAAMVESVNPTGIAARSGREGYVCQLSVSVDRVCNCL